MATGRQVQLTKQVGEYLVAAELSRRELLTATFAGNVPDYDIVATGGKGQTALVQVKAIAGPSWQFDIRRFADVRCQAGAQTMGQPNRSPRRSRERCLTAPGAGHEEPVFPWSRADTGFRNHVLRLVRKNVPERYFQVEVTSGRVGRRGSQPASYHRYRFPPDIISHAVRLSYRCCLSFRDAEDRHCHLIARRRSSPWRREPSFSVSGHTSPCPMRRMPG